MSAVEDATVVGGRYRLAERIGRGGMADVYRATDEVLDRVVAVKWLRQPALEASDVARARSEARLLARLNHPALVTVHDAGVDKERPYLVMELVDGPSLAKEVPSGPATVASVGARVAEALAYVHGQGLVHRDVKPGNVLAAHSPGPWGQVKLADFGIARLLDTTRLTSTGTVVGTTAFCAPEQLRGDTVGPAADVWSLGLVLIECLSGEPAYPGDPADTTVVRLRRPPTVPASLPAEWIALLRAMTALDASARPRSSVVADRLYRLAASAAKRETPVATRPRRPVPDTESLPPTEPALPPTAEPALAGSLTPATARPAGDRVPADGRSALERPGERLSSLAQRLGSVSLGQRRHVALLVAALAAAVVIVIVLAVALPGGGTPSTNTVGKRSPASGTANGAQAATVSGSSRTSPLPAPNVPGPIGNELRALHHAVNP